ncbi:MarR family winged helix-turn-helix transcriptional regulator [Streptomyces sp. NPDC001985]|uniref:MarR family winged helix-turn-helix transcriptional regulator n=1 Tax=Streptomyces sp. NPDC001985 TaxID=3154406 RepID=UPI0033256F19
MPSSPVTPVIPVTPSPADPFAPDDALTTQPVGYWTGRAHRAVTTRLRAALARVDVTQPQWQTMNRVDAPGGLPTRDQVIAQLTPTADGPHEISRVIDQLLHRGWLTAGPGDRLGLTDAGRAAKARIRELVTEVRAEVHEGVTDEEYVAALRVLRRMITNAEGSGPPVQN